MEALRDRLLLALSEPGPKASPALVAVEPGAALLAGVGRLPLWIINQAPGDGRDVLEARVRGAGQAVRSGPVAVAVLSTDPSVPGWLASMVDEVAPKVAALYSLAMDGSVRTVAGDAHLPLEQAFDRAVFSDAFPPPESLAEAILDRRRALVKDAADTQAFARRMGSAGKPMATWALMAACGVVFLLQLLWGAGDATLVAGRMGAGSGAKLASGDWWRLFSPAFLHANWMHVGMNMFALYALGPTMESILGRSRFVVLYLACAMGASLTTGLLNPDVSSVGASGAVWGLMGAMLGLALRPNGLLPAPMVSSLRRGMLTPILINTAISFLPGIDMWGHFGGGAAGLLLMLSGVFTGGLRRQARDGASPRSTIFAGLAVVLVLAATASVAAAIAQGQPWRIQEAPGYTRQPLADTPFEVSWPAGLEVKPAERLEGGPLRIVVGDLSLDPVVVQLTVAQMPDTPVAALVAELDREFTPPEPARVERIQGREIAVANAKSHGLPLEVATTSFDGWSVAVMVVRAPKAPASWQGIAARVAASIRPRPDP